MMRVNDNKWRNDTLREITVGAEATKLLQIAGITVTSSRRLATQKERNISESKLDQNGSLNDVRTWSL